MNHYYTTWRCLLWYALVYLTGLYYFTLLYHRVILGYQSHVRSLWKWLFCYGIYCEMQLNMHQYELRISLTFVAKYFWRNLFRSHGTVYFIVLQKKIWCKLLPSLTTSHRCFVHVLSQRTLGDWLFRVCLFVVDCDVINAWHSLSHVTMLFDYGCMFHECRHRSQHASHCRPMGCNHVSKLGISTIVPGIVLKPLYRFDIY